MEAQRLSSEGKCIYEQLCQSLVDLHHAADRVFNTIVNRVSMEHGRLNNLTSRISCAKAKVATISSTNQTTTLFSSAKYPSVDADKSDFKPLFPKPLKVNLPVDGGLQDEEEGTIELFRFFSETNHEYMLDAFKIKDGIGYPPVSLKSVADLLLFNSTELPYSKYKIVDNLEDPGQPSVESHNKSIITLPPPPESILHGGMAPTSGVEEYGFRPAVRQVPSFKLPSSLPHLPMAVKDSQAGKTNVPLVAPVRSHSSAHSHKSTSTYADKSDVRSSKDSEEAFTDYDIKDNDFRPPPPPPLPPPSRSPSFKVKDEAEAASTSNSQVKPALAAKEPFSGVVSKELGDTSTNVSDAACLPLLVNDVSDSQHNALMTSIRNPGIALRKTGSISSKTWSTLPSPIEQNKNVKGAEPQTLSPQRQHFDILAEMATTLKMRRLSMQGASPDTVETHTVDASKLISKDDETATTGIAHENRSSKLPPPMVNLQAYITQAKDALSNDEEWDD